MNFQKLPYMTFEIRLSSGVWIVTRAFCIVHVYATLIDMGYVRRDIKEIRTVRI